MITTIILGVHIAIAITSLVLAVISCRATFRKNMPRANKNLRSGWIGTLLTVASGVVLAVVSQISFGRLCVSLFIFLVVIAMAQTYYSLTAYRLQKVDQQY